MQRRLTQLLHWLGVDSIALGIVFGISLLFLPLALWKPGCLLAFTHLQWALILCALVRDGWLRAFRFNCELGGGYLTWLQCTGYNGRQPPPFHSPLRTPWDLLALGLLLGYAGLLTRVSPFYFWVGGTPEPFIFGVLPLAWFLADLFGTLALCKLMRQRAAGLAAAWLLPAMLLCRHHPYALLAIGVCQFAINQWSLRRGLQALPHLPPAGEVKDPFSIVGGLWAALAPRKPKTMSRAQRWWIPLLVAWWALTLTPNVELIWSSKFLVTSSMVVLLIFWGFTTFVKCGVGFPQFLALRFGVDYAWRGWRWMIGPLLGLALLRLLWQSDAIFLQTPWPLPSYVAVATFLLLKLVLEWNALTAPWALTGVQQAVFVPRFSLSLVFPTNREQWANLNWFRLEPSLGQTKSPGIHHPSNWQLLLRLRLSRWRGNYLTRIGQDALMMLGLVTLLAWFFARFMQDRELPPLTAFMLVIVASFGYSVRRLYEFFPPMNRRYREFLRGTAWQPGKPLPLGPSHIHWIDFAVVLGTTTALFLMFCFFFDIPHIFSHSPTKLAAILLLCSAGVFMAPRLTFGFWLMLKFELIGHLCGIGVLAPLFVLFGDNPPVLIGTAISIAIINEFALQAGLRLFPWNEPRRVKWSHYYGGAMDAFQVRGLFDYPPEAPNWGWLLNIGPFVPKLKGGRAVGIMMLILLAWWTVALISLPMDESHPPVAALAATVVTALTILSAILRRAQLESAIEPLGFLGRLKFGCCLILWRHDRIAFQMFGVLLLELAVVGLGIFQRWSPQIAIPAACIVFPLAMYYGMPEPRRYFLTGIHRIRLKPRMQIRRRA